MVQQYAQTPTPNPQARKPKIFPARCPEVAGILCQQIPRIYRATPSYRRQKIRLFIPSGAVQSDRLQTSRHRHRRGRGDLETNLLSGQ